MMLAQPRVWAGRHPFSLLLFNNNNLARSSQPSSQLRTTSLQLHISHLRHPLQISATLEGNVTESFAGAKLVKVKFVLQRRCEFGQQFLVVGDDEVFGAWKPEAALPMQWSEGHIWTTELEVSTGKRIEFKVILMGDKGVLEWQPGPNRVLETMESSSPLVVLETWSGKNQVDALLALEMNELSDAQIVSPESMMNAGSVELPIPVVDSEAVSEDIKTTVDGALSEQSILVTEKKSMSLSQDDSNTDVSLPRDNLSTDMARELSVLEKDLQWVQKALSTLWNKLTKE